ncbi:MAG: ABC transporter ATP-binding protein [Kiritimatiellia bacterium]|nr:ABC transporter ATP-binding protein [Lentisphaerota bacterium]
MSLLEIEQLRVQYQADRRMIPAVDGVDLTVGAAESVGLVGESGCGKSSLAAAVVRLVPVASGTVRFDGQPLEQLRGGALRRFRRRVQMVFQDPYGSLNPRMTIGAALEEALAVHGLGARPQRLERVAELLQCTGLDPGYAGRYPHELSGGQRQRVGIARALTLRPQLIIADEPVSALDVSVQAQILGLMSELQRSAGVAWLFIAHDLAVVKHMCSRVYVMYLGRIVESGLTTAVFRRPAHPYTEALAAAAPDIDRALAAGGAAVPLLRGEPPASGTLITGCPFHPRCPYAREICRNVPPALENLTEDRRCSCHLARERWDAADV